jgi:hypothetical protein
MMMTVQPFDQFDDRTDPGTDGVPIGSVRAELGVSGTSTSPFGHPQSPSEQTRSSQEPSAVRQALPMRRGPQAFPFASTNAESLLAWFGELDESGTEAEHAARMEAKDSETTARIDRANMMETVPVKDRLTAADGA